MTNKDKILGALTHEPTYIGDIVQRTGISARDVAEVLTLACMDGEAYEVTPHSYRLAPFKAGDMIGFNDDPTGSEWGIVSALSDDGSTLYYKPRGTGLFRGNCRCDQAHKLPH